MTKKQGINLVKNFIGVDIGGMTVKGIIIRGDGTVLVDKSTYTDLSRGGDSLADCVINLINDMILEQGGFKSQYLGVGVGCPGVIDSKNGTVVFAGNLNLRYYPLAKKISDAIGLPVTVVNDANAAALGEAKFGAGKKYTDSVLITLGTGVGGGVVIGGKLYEGFKSAGTELGHMVIVRDGEPCTCGRRGCFEAYTSATALMKRTREAMIVNRESKMWQTYIPETVSGKTSFEYMDVDESAKAVVDWYVGNLICGIVNIANIFRPQIVIIGGGVCEQGEKLIAPIRKGVESELFAGTDYAPVKVEKATLGKRAGAFGAAALYLE